MIMPFGGWNDEYHEHIFKPALLEAGMEPHRADVFLALHGDRLTADSFAGH